jgi:membrane protease YdiL (CAAX protease family)
MKIYQRLGLIILLSLLLSCLLSPLAWLVLQSARNISPVLQRALDYPFYRVMDRVVLVVTVLLLYRNRSKLEIVSLASMGLKRSSGWCSLLWRGWLLGACSLTLMVLTMVPYGARKLDISFTGVRELAAGLCMAFITGAVVGFIEEVFFRGFILQSLLRNLRRWAAVIAMSLFFAIVHFFKAPDMPVRRGFDPLAGFKAVAYYLQPLLHPTEVLPAFVGLFLVGVVLACAYLWSGSLYLSIGLHAGWVFGIKAEDLFLDRQNVVVPWFFGDGYVVTGVFGWFMLLLMLAIVRCCVPRPAQPCAPKT